MSLSDLDEENYDKLLFHNFMSEWKNMLISVLSLLSPL